MGNDRRPVPNAFWGAPNQFPDEAIIPGFRRFLQLYHDELVQVARKVLRVMALALGQPLDFFDRMTTLPTSVLRLLHYSPLQNQTTQVGAGAHTDYGLITLLLQDHVGGLQVLDPRDEEWLTVAPTKGALVVNLGDMMGRITRGEFKSTIHRVVSNTTQTRDRYSAPFFFNPNIDAEIVPIGGDTSDGTCEEVLDSFYRKAHFKSGDGRDGVDPKKVVTV